MLNERSQLNVLSVRLSVSWVFSLFFPPHNDCCSLSSGSPFRFSPFLQELP